MNKEELKVLVKTSVSTILKMEERLREEEEAYLDTVKRCEERIEAAEGKIEFALNNLSEEEIEDLSDDIPFYCIEDFLPQKTK